MNPISLDCFWSSSCISALPFIPASGLLTHHTAVCELTSLPMHQHSTLSLPQARPVFSVSPTLLQVNKSLFNAAAAPVLEPDVPGVAHAWVQQPSQCCLHVSHVSE